MPTHYDAELLDHALDYMESHGYEPINPYDFGTTLSALYDENFVNDLRLHARNLAFFDKPPGK